MERKITALVGKVGFIMQLDKTTRLRLSIIASILAIIPYLIFNFLNIPYAKFLGILVGFAVYIYGHYENADNANITKIAIMFIITSSVLGIFQDRIIINRCIYRYHTIAKAKILSLSQGRGYAIVTYKFCHNDICVENSENLSKDRSQYMIDDTCYVDFNHQNLKMSHIYPKGVFPEKDKRKSSVIFVWEQLGKLYKIILLIALAGTLLAVFYLIRPSAIIN